MTRTHTVADLTATSDLLTRLFDQEVIPEVAQLVLDRVRDLLDAVPPTSVATAGSLPAGRLVCPKCQSTGVATVERMLGDCDSTITRTLDGTVTVEQLGETDINWDLCDTIGATCTACRWQHIGAGWSDHLAAVAL